MGPWWSGGKASGGWLAVASAARWKPSSGPLLHQRFWKMWLSWGLWKLPVKHPPRRPCIFAVQFRPCLLLALLLNSTFCPSWQLLKKAGWHLLEFRRVTGGGGPIPHSASRDLLFWRRGRATSTHAIYHLVSNELPFLGDRRTKERMKESQRNFLFSKWGTFILFDVQPLPCFSYLFSGKTPIWWQLVTSLSYFRPVIYPKSKLVNTR